MSWPRLYHYFFRRDGVLQRMLPRPLTLRLAIAFCFQPSQVRVAHGPRALQFSRFLDVHVGDRRIQRMASACTSHSAPENRAADHARSDVP